MCVCVCVCVCVCIYIYIMIFIYHFCCLVAQSCLTLCNPLDCSLPASSVHGMFSSKNTGMGCCFLLQGIFPSQGSNPCLLYYRQILLPAESWGSPCISLHIFFFRFFSIKGYQKILNIVTCAIQQVLVDLFCIQQCVSINPKLLIYPSPLLVPSV